MNMINTKFIKQILKIFKINNKIVMNNKVNKLSQNK